MNTSSVPVAVHPSGTIVPRGWVGPPLLFGVLLVILLVGCTSRPPEEGTIGFAVHGGVGNITRDRMTPDLENAYRTSLAEALQTGYSILDTGGTSLDAVEAAVRIMEDSPLYNAGKGAVFTSAGTNELDASIMDGSTLKAGAVAAVRRLKNPIRVARLVMEKTWHVLLSGEGAEEFAREMGIELVSPDYFRTQRRWEQWQKTRGKETGTVGAVALDRMGNLAAATSTGGLTNKRFGRVGDSPIVGAGTYANNRTCAVSGTGQGEYFMRGLVAYDISALMEYRGLSIREAAHTVVMEKLSDLGGTGGVIAIDRYGNVATPFNTSGMFRGYIDSDGTPVVKIYRED
ncbi:MAG: isoaspartyl peptidase/L-asparaginase family protein [Fidelibacterota bacterium]